MCASRFNAWPIRVCGSMPLHTAAEIQTFLVEEATELCGGERVLLVLERDGETELAHSLLPRGEDARTLSGLDRPYPCRAFDARGPSA
jgi:hypothetical protein